MDRQPTKTEVSQEAKAHRLAINEAAATGPAELVREVVQRYRDSNDFYMAAHNAALSALTKWHSYDEPLQDILDVFEEMLIHNLNPNKDSYGTVIEALAQRDHNVQLRANQLRSELFEANRNALTQQERSAPSPPSSHIARSLEAQLDSLSKDDSCTAAFQFYKALGEQRRKRLPQAAFHALLQLCIRHKRNKDAVAVVSSFVLLLLLKLLF